MASPYSKDDLRLIWKVLKEKGSASAAETALRVNHDFSISKVTILEKLRSGALDSFGEPGEAEKMRKETRERQGIRYGQQRKVNGRTKVRPVRTLHDQASNVLEQRESDERILKTFSDDRLTHLPEGVSQTLSVCKYPSDEGGSCGKHTMTQLFVGRVNVPPDLRFGTHCDNYCTVHIYALLTTDGRRRLMDAVSSLSLSCAA